MLLAVEHIFTIAAMTHWYPRLHLGRRTERRPADPPPVSEVHHAVIKQSSPMRQPPLEKRD